MANTFQTKFPKVSLIMVMSVNGVVAQKEIQNSFEWNSSEDRQQFLQKTKEIGTVLMGSNTYRSIGGKPYQGINFNVMTRHPEQFQSHERVTFRNGSIVNVLAELADSGIDHIALLGGSNTNAQCFNAGLVDEIFLTIEPLMMPEGMHIADNLSRDVHLKLESLEPLNDTKTLLLHYSVTKQTSKGR